MRGLVPVLIVLVIIMIYVYSRPKLEAMSPLGYGRDDINDHRRIYYHYTSWCKYCRLWRPIIDDVKVATRGSNIEFIEVDEDIAKTPYVQFFPSIYMLNESGERHQYKGPPEFKRFRDWVVSPLRSA